MTEKVKSRDRKVGVMVMLTPKVIEFLDRKINKKNEKKDSRSALIMYLIGLAMEKPELLD